MGKNQRHKKDLKAEKAKVKLKQSKTKFLPKGLNVTNTAFKVKPIVLLEQLKEKSSEDILSKRKLNVKDLLSRIKHYNENIRHTACQELSDMIKVYTEEIIQQHLSQVCLAISSLMQDRERKVRKAAVKCIEIILGNVPSEKLAPFFDFFSTNLRCAMTNIDKNVQEDSLLFLDCFINRNCDLITQSSEKLLPDFLSLISKLRSDSHPGRTLTLNLGSKMTSVSWRIKVLSRLHLVLKIVLEKAKGSELVSENSEQIFNANQDFTFPIYKKELARKLENCSLDIFLKTKSVVYGGFETINRHIGTLVPLLYETWMEVMPEQKVQKSTSEISILSGEMGVLLTCIMNTLYLLWQYVNIIKNEDINLKTVFMSPDGQKFLKHLLDGFPYCHTGYWIKLSSDNSFKMLERNVDPKCVQENLLICFLYLVLCINGTQQNLRKEASAIVSYITKLLSHKTSLNEESMRCLTELLTECFGKNSQKWQRVGVNVQSILENAIELYDHGKINDYNKVSLFQILSTVNNNEQLSRCVKYQNWLSTLPNILCQASVNDTAVLALLDLSKTNCEEFHSALVRKLPEIMDNLEKLQITVTLNSLLQTEEATKRSLASIFYYVPTYSSADLQVFRDFIDKSRSSFREYLEEVLNLRDELRNI